MKIIGLDIGGANIKISDTDGHTRSIAFPMWTQKEELTETLMSAMASEATPDMVALTMTAELADCFVTKEEGVLFVIDAVESAFPEVPMRVWMTSGEFAEPSDARELTMLVAAANWHALATWAARAVPNGPALLIDVGSTTTDIIPLLDGFPVPRGRNDLQRLQSGELVYTGALRTPICAVVKHVSLRGTSCPVSAELFATMADALLMAEMIPEQETCTDTADGRPLTREWSLGRLARMLCCDVTEIAEDELVGIATHVCEVQQQQLQASAEAVIADLGVQLSENGDGARSLNVEKPTVLISGSGGSVAQQLVDRMGADRFGSCLTLSEMFYRSVADAACAFAVARLAHDMCRDDLLELSAF